MAKHFKALEHNIKPPSMFKKLKSRNAGQHFFLTVLPLIPYFSLLEDGDDGCTEATSLYLLLIWSSG